MGVLDKRHNFWKSCMASMILIPIGILLLSVLIGISVDVICTREADLWLAHYPGAEVVSEEYNFIRPFGIGVTTRVLHTSEEIDIVRPWYIERDRENIRNAIYPNRQVAAHDWTVEERQDGGGTRITLHLQCADGLVLFER